MKELLATLLLCAGTIGFGQEDNVSLIVESYPAVQEGLTTFRFYIGVPSFEHHVGGVWGLDDRPLGLLSEAEIYNHPFNTGPTSAWMGSALIQNFPEVADDSFVTIGLTGSAEFSGLEGSQDPIVFDDPSNSLASVFLAGGATGMQLQSNDTMFVSNPSGWFLQDEDAINGRPSGAEPKVLVMQISTSGNLQGVINVSVWNAVLEDAWWHNGTANNEFAYRIYFEGVGEFPPSTPGSGPQGCTDAEACNFDVLALIEDGSCEYSCNYCLEGTTWDETLQGCVPSSSVCGSGTVWDEETQTCIVAHPSDIDFDGCVGINDFLVHLSNFGSGCGPEPAWACGDPLEYQGHDYETVQIGEQCWFAENLRSSEYRSGVSIPTDLSDAEWSAATSGAAAVYGSGPSCLDYSPDGDACDEAWSLNEYGRLYNWFAVDDPRGLCPNGWHVPSNSDWSDLIGLLGGEAIAGQHLKSEYGWNGGGQGTNSSGFSGLPAGDRSIIGFYDFAGHTTGWWTSTADGASAWARGLSYAVPSSYQNSSSNPRIGFSVRCLQDTE